MERSLITSLKPIKVNYRNHNNYNEENVKRDPSRLKLILNDNDVNKMYLLVQNCSNILDRHAPLKYKYIKTQYCCIHELETWKSDNEAIQTKK